MLQIIGLDVGKHAASQQAINETLGIAFRRVPNVEEASQLCLSFHSIMRLGRSKSEFDQNIDGHRGVFKYEMHLLQKNSLWNLYAAVASAYNHRHEQQQPLQAPPMTFGEHNRSHSPSLDRNLAPQSPEDNQNPEDPQKIHFFHGCCQRSPATML